jgi:Tol biopolymer transport system component
MPAWRSLLPNQISRLVVVDAQSGAQTTVHESSTHVFEAPNWTPDGSALIFNEDGLFYRLAADGSGEPELVNTGPVADANNDHVISADGYFLYVSSQDSHLYEVGLPGGPADGVVRRVSNDNGESFVHYLHGVSPDGSTLAYIGMQLRQDRPPLTNIFTVPVAGGADTQLTDSEKPHDGSEYSPDGQWIYFSSERASTIAGHAQLFRMRLDGSEVTQLSFDERVNWFPHVAPDGSTMVYVSFEPGVLGHPANHEVIIRSMSPDGGEHHDMMTLFGGQGTMNVASWAPDSRRFALVEYPIL